MRVFARTQLAALLYRRPVIHLLHIGKTGGSALAATFAWINRGRTAPVRFVRHRHSIRLRHLPATASYCFAVRDPIRRFVSAFYSRKRKGQPRTYSEWSVEEARAFAAFEHANCLAEAIFEPGPRGSAAVSAMRHIQHVSDWHRDWFDEPERVLRERPPLQVLRQEQLAEDFAVLMHRLGIHPYPPLPESPILSHRNDYRDIPPLSDKARANLERWYAADIAFVDAARELAEYPRGLLENSPGGSARPLPHSVSRRVP